MSFIFKIQIKVIMHNISKISQESTNPPNFNFEKKSIMNMKELTLLKSCCLVLIFESGRKQPICSHIPIDSWV